VPYDLSIPVQVLDVRMVECCKNFGFALKSGDALGIADERRR
jgi:hypothetical protein